MPNERKTQGRHDIGVNVGGTERVLSMLLGGGLIGYALTRGRPAAKLLALPGVLLLARGRTGRSLLYTLFDVSTVPRTGGQAERTAAPGGEPQPATAAGAGAAGQAAGSQPGPDSPRPRVPGKHEHPVPPNELGVPSVDVTPKLMREVAVPSSEGESEPGGGE